MAASDYHDITQLLYIAYCGRPADPAGMHALATSLYELGAPNTVAELSAAYSVPANVQLRALLDSVGASAESARLYSAATTADFVANVFDNILHRAPAAAGLSYWSAELDSGRVGRAEAALKIMAGAYLNTTNPEQARLDRKTIEYKLDAASHFTLQLDRTDTAQFYRGESAAWQARYMLSLIDSVNAPGAFQVVVDSVIRQIAQREAVTTPLQLANGSAYIGSEASDRVLVGATTTGVALGNGNDVAFLKVAALGAGGLLDGGAGTDTLVMSGADAVVAARAGTLAAISGFERLTLTSVTNQRIDIDRLDDIAYVTLGGVNPGAVDGAVLNNLASGSTVAIDGGVAALTVNVRNAAAGAADLLHLSLSANFDLRFGTITVPDVETIVFLSHDAALVAAALPSSQKLIAPALKHLVSSGAAGLRLQIEAKQLQSVDATGQSGSLDIKLIGQLDGALATKGGSGHNTVDFSWPLGGVTYTGGAARDEIKAGSGTTVIDTGAGGDKVDLLGGAHRVDLGDGDDSVIAWFSGASVIRGGAGSDEFTFNGPGERSGSLFPTISDFAMDEHITFYYMGLWVDQEPKVGAAVAPGAGASFQQYLDAATAADGSGHNGKFNWFVFDGDTYLTVDRSASASFQNGLDQLVKLTGVYDLSDSLFSNGTLYGTAI